MNRYLKWIIYFAAIYLTVIVIYYLRQEHYIYYPKDTYRLSESALKKAQTKRISVISADGIALTGLYSPAPSIKRPTIIYFHGNQGNVDMRFPLLERYKKTGFGVMLASYRGYNGSAGKPTEQGLYQDARAAINYVLAQGTAPQCIILFGSSLGSGVAVQMATEYPVGALILRSPYTSLTDVGYEHFPFLPIDWLLEDRFDSYQKIEKITAPKLILHGEKDKVIPYRLGYRLYTKAREPKQMVSYPNAGHNNVRPSHDVIQFIETNKIIENCNNTEN